MKSFFSSGWNFYTSEARLPSHHDHCCFRLLTTLAVVEWTLIARFMGPTLGPSGADRTQMGPMLAPWTLLSGNTLLLVIWYHEMLVSQAADHIMRQNEMKNAPWKWSQMNAFLMDTFQLTPNTATTDKCFQLGMSSIQGIVAWWYRLLNAKEM